MASAVQAERIGDDLGILPVWDLSDLYAGMEAPEVKRDLERSAALSEAFEARYKGKLAELAAAADGGARLAEAIGGYERIEEVMGRLGSYRRASSTRATRPTRRARSSTATCRSG